MIHVHVLYRLCAIKGTMIKYCMSGSQNYLVLPLSDIRRARISGVRVSDFRLYYYCMVSHDGPHGTKHIIMVLPAVIKIGLIVSYHSPYYILQRKSGLKSDH